MIRNKKILYILIDFLLIFISITAAYLIRSRFILFFYTDLFLLYTLPYVFLFRFLNNLIFDLYSLNLYYITIRDITKIYLYNLIPSFIFIIIRFLSPIDFLRIPLSIIFAEYFFTILLSKIKFI